MRTIKFSFFDLLFSFSLFVAVLPLSTTAQETVVSISEVEMNIIDQNPDMSYVYLGRDRSNIINFLSQLCAFDQNINSPLHKLCEHIRNGFFIAEYDEVLNVLEHAASILDNHNKRSHNINKKQLIKLNLQYRDITYTLA